MPQPAPTTHLPYFIQGDFTPSAAKHNLKLWKAHILTLSAPIQIICREISENSCRFGIFAIHK